MKDLQRIKEFFSKSLDEATKKEETLVEKVMEKLRKL